MRRQSGLRFVEFGQHRETCLVEGFPRLRSVETSRRSLKKTNAEPVFQSRDAFADRRSGQPEPIGGCGEAAGLDHADEDSDPLQVSRAVAERAIADFHGPNLRKTCPPVPKPK